MELHFFLKVIHSKGRQYAYLARSVRRGEKVKTEILVNPNFRRASTSSREDWNSVVIPRYSG